MSTQSVRVDNEIPDKLFFKIGEVCDLVGVQAHVLRYWESEFPSFQPQKNRAGQRTYRRKDVEMAMRIKELLYGEGFTIAGAKRKLASESRAGNPRLKIVPPNAGFTPEEEIEELPLPAPVAQVTAPVAPAAAVPVAPPIVPPTPAPPTSRANSRDGLQRLKFMLEDILTTLDRNVIE